MDITNYTVTINKIELNNYGIVPVDGFILTKKKYCFFLYTSNSDLMSGCGNKMMTVYYTIS